MNGERRNLSVKSVPLEISKTADVSAKQVGEYVESRTSNVL